MQRDAQALAENRNAPADAPLTSVDGCRGAAVWPDGLRELLEFTALCGGRDKGLQNSQRPAVHPHVLASDAEAELLEVKLGGIRVRAWRERSRRIAWAASARFASNRRCASAGPCLKAMGRRSADSASRSSAIKLV